MELLFFEKIITSEYNKLKAKHISIDLELLNDLIWF